MCVFNFENFQGFHSDKKSKHSKWDTQVGNILKGRMDLQKNDVFRNLWQLLFLSEFFLTEAVKHLYNLESSPLP